MNDAMTKPETAAGLPVPSTPLLACPFCGFESQMRVDVPYESRVICAKCGAGTGNHNSRSEAEYAWQQRHANSVITPDGGKVKP